MALKFKQTGLPNLLKDGYQHLSGLDEAGYKNIQACNELAQITRSSFGPNGRNKMIINHLEKLFVTNDAATILKELEVFHPAATLVALASKQQEAEMGDGTNSVIIYAGEFLNRAEELLRMGLHGSEIIDGYEIAVKKVYELLDELAAEEIKDLKNEQDLLKILLPSIGSKQYGYETFLSNLVAKACINVMPRNAKMFNVDNVRIVKILGGGVLDSQLINGMLFNREAEGTVTKATNAKIAIFSCPLDISRTETKGTVLIHDAKEMMSFSKGEESSLETAFKELADAGVKVLVTSGAIADLALHFINRFEMMVIKILSKFELRRLCRVTGATVLARLGVPMAEETGYCDVVEATEIGSDRCTIFRQEKEDSKTVSIVLRGGTLNVLDDMERAIDDGVNVVKAVAKNPKLLPGAGAVDIEIARRLYSIGEKTSGLSQYAIKKFAEAFEVVPKTLADNAGMDSTEIVSKLYAAHQQGNLSMGVDIEVSQSETNGLLDAKKLGYYESLSVKKNSIRLAADAAINVLSVDQIIMSKPAGGPKVKQNKQFDEDD